MTIKEGHTKPRGYFNHIFHNGITLADMDRHGLKFGGHYEMDGIPFRVEPCNVNHELVVGVEVLEEAHADPVIDAIKS